MTEQITKISENNVELKISKTLTDINDVDFEVWDDPISYGQDRIDSETIEADTELADATSLDSAAYKQGLQDEAQVKISRLVLIQSEMDKIVITKT